MNEIAQKNSTDLTLPIPSNLVEAMSFAKILSTSGLIPETFKGCPEKILVAMMWSQQLRIPPLQGMQYICVVNGKPSLYGDGLMALVRASGLLVDIKETVAQVNGVLTATCEVKRKDTPTPVIGVFSLKDAERAGLMTKAVWKAYPQRMLKMRARSYALRDAFPDVLSGMAIAEEQDDIAPIVQTGDASIQPPAETEEKPVRKMPRKKKKAEQVDDVTDVEEKKVEDVTENVTEEQQEAALTASQENPISESRFAEVEAQILGCKTYEDLKGLWSALCAEEREEFLPLMQQQSAVLPRG